MSSKGKGGLWIRASEYLTSLNYFRICVMKSDKHSKSYHSMNQLLFDFLTQYTYFLEYCKKGGIQPEVHISRRGLEESRLYLIEKQ